MLFGNQNDYSFIASICIPIVPFEKAVYLSDSHSRDVVGIPNENGFSNVSNFQTTKLLQHIHKIYLLILHSWNLKIS